VAEADVRDLLPAARRGDQPSHPPSHCRACPVRKLTLFGNATPDALDRFQSIRRGSRFLHPRDIVVREGEIAVEAFTVFDGWAFRYKLFATGRRQILDFVLPGDFIGIQENADRSWNHSITCITPASLCVFDRAGLLRLVGDHAGDLAQSLLGIARTDQAVLFEHMTQLGRAPAEERIVHLFLELFARLKMRGLVEGNGCFFPLTQDQIGDATGLTAIHVNRIIQRLRRAGKAHFGRRWLTLSDPERLATEYGIDLGYLERRPLA
jgi:CRP/FNR family transcriptional regulator, anaerobic regulatory protein